MNMYLNIRKIDSYYNLHIKVITGARGIGKTYAIMKKFVKAFIYEKKRFVWLRDNENAIETLCAKNGEKFFKDMRTIFTNVFSVRGNMCYIDGELCGYLMSTSTFYNTKGSAFFDVKNICYDEFIPEKGQRKNKHRVVQFLNTIESIGRTRNDYNVYMLSNALNKNDEFFSIFNIKINNYGYYFNKQKGVVFLYSKNNPTYDKAHKESISGKLISGTVYDESITQNKFDFDDNLYFDKKPKKCSLYCILHNEYDESICIYIGEKYLYIDVDKNKNIGKDVRFVKSGQYVTSNTRVIPKHIKDILILQRNNSYIRYKNGYCYNIFNDFLL